MEELVMAGYLPDVAEALAERGVTAEQAQHMSRRELFEEYLHWHGIIGYCDQIVEALDAITELTARRAGQS